MPRLKLLGYLLSQRRADLTFPIHVQITRATKVTKPDNTLAIKVNLDKSLRVEIPERRYKWEPDMSGDLESFPEIKKYTPPLQLQGIPEYEECPEVVKRVLSAEFQNATELQNIYRKDLLDRVRQHPFDEESLEAVAAKLTARIRFLQPYVKKRDKADVKCKIELNGIVQARELVVGRLRESDYPKYEWLLEQLQYVYKPLPKDNKEVRKAVAMLKLTAWNCEILKEQKIAKKKKELDLQKVPFLESKIEKLKYIMEVEKKYDLPPTVTNEEIEEVAKQLEKVKLEVKDIENKKYERTIDPHTLEAYFPEKETTAG